MIGFGRAEKTLEDWRSAEHQSTVWKNLTPLHFMYRKTTDVDDMSPDVDGMSFDMSSNVDDLSTNVDDMLSDVVEPC